jgi:hypothetical protein
LPQLRRRCRVTAACTRSGEILVLVTTTSCVSQVHDLGGTPGGPSVQCPQGDKICTQVVDALEARRDNIGGWCGTPNAAAHAMLLQQGAAAIPYLARAFDDRDTEVAVFAMRTTVDLGGTSEVVDWCRDVRDLYRLDMCRAALGAEPRRRL